jgi:hypothetical protein
MYLLQHTLECEFKCQRQITKAVDDRFLVYRNVLEVHEETSQDQSTGPP